MYVNKNIIPVEIIPEMARRGMKGVNSDMIYLIHCKKFCKCQNVPLPRTTIKKIKSQVSEEFL
jgi:hypothetical protein